MWMLRSSEPDLSFRLLPGDVRTIGRAAGVQFIVDAPLVSRVHCRLTLSPDGDLTVEDLGSTNGTYVNDLRVEHPTALQPADTLKVGRVSFAIDRRASDTSL
jgi:pSer/pThr/pTyr-binding forkhead associated (FHA) protein